MVTADELSNGLLFEAPDSVVLCDWIVACFFKVTVVASI